MSYSFSWDCKLPISNIQDIISINIVPETTTYHEEEYLNLRGNVCIQGEYLARNGEQQIFDEKIPLDITLPNNRNVNQIETELTNFDYDVREGEALFLTVDLILVGYDLELEEPKASVELDANYLLERDELDYGDLEELVLDAPIEVVDLTKPKDEVEQEMDLELSTEGEDSDREEADLVLSTEGEDSDREEADLELSTEGEDSNREEVELELPTEGEDNDRKEVDLELPTEGEDNREEVDLELPTEGEDSDREEVELELSTEGEDNDRKEMDLELPTEDEDDDRKEINLKKMTEKLKPTQVVETVTEATSDVAKAVTETVSEVTEKLKPSNVAKAVSESVTEVTEKLKPAHVVEVATEVADKLKPSNVAKTITETVGEVTDKLNPFHVSEVTTEAHINEEILPFPINPDKASPKEGVQSLEKANLFDMLYDLEKDATSTGLTKCEMVPEDENSEKACKEITKELSLIEEEIEYNQEKNSFFDDRIASQFADGASIIKIVFIQEEATIGSICEQYEINETAIFNLNALESPLKHGDCVMINYGRVQ